MRILSILLLILCNLRGYSQPLFSSFFEERSLRIDYARAGNDKDSYVFVDELIAEPFWGGSKVNLIDTMRYGMYFFEVFDKNTTTLIYSRGYTTLFSEWQTTDEAKTLRRSFSETLLMPFPKNEITVILYQRAFETGEFVEQYRFDINPKSYFIKRDNRMTFPVSSIENNGDAATKVDIVLLPEGYSAEEMKLFLEDCNTFAKGFFLYEPYKSYREKFNLWAVLAPSAESNVDIPKDSVWKKTILNCSYYTFDNERYLMTTDNKSVRDVASNAPYDQIYILVNSTKYGGGGIFNHYCISVNGSKSSDKIHAHEFGHGFSGLADEYVGTVTYNDMYNLAVEPFEPNITTLVNFDKKWKDSVDKNTPIPTPADAKYLKKVGVFEGGGYAKENVYRPMQDCLMNTFNGNEFCSVCRRAIVEMINFYTK